MSVCKAVGMGSWIAGLLGAETAAALAVMAVVLMAYLTTKVHSESRQNAREHAELREAINSLGEMVASLREMVASQAVSIARLEESAARRAESTDLRFDSNDRRFDAIDRRFDATDRRFDATDRKLDQLLIHLVKDRSDKDD